MIIDLGIIDYHSALIRQKNILSRRMLDEVDDTLIIAEHYPVITIGRSGSIGNIIAGECLLRSKRIDILKVDRGGDVTIHAPGQIVAYPIIDLKARGRDLHKYLRDLETSIIGFLRYYSVSAGRIAGKTGVWTGNKKIASIGIAARNWVTYHGASINVNTDLSYFDMIFPCGMRNVGAASLSGCLGHGIDMARAKEALVGSMKDVFDIDGVLDYLGNTVSSQKAYCAQ